MRVSSTEPQRYDCSALRSNQKSQFHPLTASISACGSNVRAALESADQAQYSDDDEVERHDVVEQAWNEENQDAGDQRHDRRDGDAHEHGGLPELSTGLCLADSRINPNAPG